MIRRRAAAAALAASVVAAVGTVVMPARVAAALCNAPSVSSIANGGNGYGHVGETVTVSGSGFAQLSCSASTVTVGGVNFASVSVNSDSQVTFTLSQSASGPVSVTDSGAGGSATSSSFWNFFTIPVASSITPTSPTVSQSLSVSGTGFSLGGQLAGLSAAYHPVAGTCGGGPTYRSDTLVTFPAFGQFCKTNGVTLTFTAYKDANRDLVTLPPTTAGQIVTVRPVVSQGAPATATPGQSVSVSGSGFGYSGTASYAGITLTSSFSDTSVSMTVPDDAPASGTLSVTRSDGAAIYSGGLTLSASISALQPAQAAVNDTVSILGAGFGTKTGSVTLNPNATPAAISRWTPTRIDIAVPGGATSGPVSVSTADGVPVTGSATLQVVPRISGVTPSHLQAGQPFEIDGTSFGTQQGSVSVNGVSALVTLWGDQQIVTAIPDGTRPGQATVSVSVPNAPAAVTTTITVDAPPPVATSTPKPGQTPGATPGATAAPTAAPSFIPPSPTGPIITTGPVPFVKPRKPPSPVDLTLAPVSDAGKPGQDIPFTVTLIAFGKPVVGAPVDLLIVVEPGTDAHITPPNAVTDSQGRVHGVIHLSRTAGDMIVLARSGQYSDEVRISSAVRRTSAVVGATSGSGSSGMATSQRILIVGLLLVCLLLFLSGFAIQMLTPRTALAGAGVGARRGQRFGPVGDASMGIAAALQFAVAMAVCAGGGVIARLRRSR